MSTDPAESTNGNRQTMIRTWVVAGSVEAKHELEAESWDGSRGFRPTLGGSGREGGFVYGMGYYFYILYWRNGMWRDEMR
jgi:hypothetical protein